MNHTLRILLIAALVALLPAVQADDSYSGGHQDGYDFAEVLEVEPLFRRVRTTVPRRECWDEEVTVRTRDRDRRSRSSVGSVIAGGVIGGVIGNQFGSGSGNDAATAVGALLGSAIAGNKGRDRNRGEYVEERVELVERCETRRETREEERADGYRVTYVYAGREYTTRTETDPGDKLRVRIAVTPSQ
ncbi:MAG: glycine zipper 2TM domain-containing protein [Gammaproteobacteria bacterium]